MSGEGTAQLPSASLEPSAVCRRVSTRTASQGGRTAPASRAPTGDTAGVGWGASKRGPRTWAPITSRPTPTARRKRRTSSPNAERAGRTLWGSLRWALAQQVRLERWHSGRRAHRKGWWPEPLARVIGPPPRVGMRAPRPSVKAVVHRRIRARPGPRWERAASRSARCGHCGGAMVAGDVPGRVETVSAWSGGRRLHLLTWGEISEGRRASVEHAASRIADVDDLEHALVRVFGHRVQRRIRGHATPDVWFEVRPSRARSPTRPARFGSRSTW